MKRKLIFRNLLILTCLATFSQKSHSMQHISIDYTKALQTTASLAAGLSAFVLSAIAHECGHAFMAKILFNSPLAINIGGYGKPRATIGPFSLSGYNPFIGYAETNLKNSRKIDRVLVALAGPISGALTSLSFSKLSDNQIYKVICCISSITHILNLYPQFGGNSGSQQLKSDGASILEECVNKKFAHKATSLLSNVIIKNAVFGIFAFLILHKMETLNLFSFDQAIDNFTKIIK